LAALGVAGALLGASWADGAASVLIGCLLVCVAMFLANETRSLIAGEAAAPPIVQAVCDVIGRDPRVRAIAELQSLHLGPRVILFAITLRFQSDLSSDALQAAAKELTVAVRGADPRIGPVFLRPD